jgi:hypothetical protein
MMKRTQLRAAVALALLPGFASVFAQPENVAGPQALVLSGEYNGTHDPSIAFDHGTYYVFATGAVHPQGPMPPPAPPVPGAPAVTRPATAQLPQFQIRCSKDLHDWKRCGAVFPSIPAMGTRHQLLRRALSPLLRLLRLRSKHVRHRSCHQRDARSSQPEVQVGRSRAGAALAGHR